MDQKTHNCLSIFVCSLVFYWNFVRTLKRYLDQVPTVPKLTEPFEKIIEINTTGYTVTHPSDSEEEIIELPRIPQRQSHPIIEPVGMIMGGMPIPMGFGMPVPIPVQGMTTVVIEGTGPIDPLLHHFVGRMLGAPL